MYGLYVALHMYLSWFIHSGVEGGGHVAEVLCLCPGFVGCAFHPSSLDSD